MNPLASALSAAISAVIDNGDYEHLYRRWFGSSPGSPTHPYPPVSRTGFPPAEEPTIRSLLERGSFRWGYALLGPPFSFVRSSQKLSNATGWDLELAALLTHAVSEAYRTRLEPSHLRLPAAPFPARLLDELEAGQIDAVLSDLAVTEQRKARADFTQPYLRATFGLLCADERRAKRLSTLEAANRPEAEILILRRAFLNELADRYLPDATHLFTDDPQELASRLVEGRADAALLPFASIHAYRQEFPHLACPELSIGNGALRAIAVRKPALKA